MIRQSHFKGILIDSNPVHPITKQARYPGHADKHQFFNNTQRDLMMICQTNLGVDLLNLIGKRHDGIGTSGSGKQRTVTIQYRPLDVSDGASTKAMHAGQRVSKEKIWGGRSMRFAGKGSKTYIQMHNGPTSQQVYTSLAGVATPTWIALAHELIHAFHHLSGTTYSDKVTVEGKDVMREEMATTGLGVYANARISENAIRNEAGLPKRTHYSFPNDHSHIGSLQVKPGKGYWYCACLQEHFGDGE